MSPQPPSPVTHLTLNAFEYFLFHLAFYLVNPNQAKMLQIQQQQTANDCIFSVLLEHYLKVLLFSRTVFDERRSFILQTRRKDVKKSKFRCGAACVLAHI